MAFTIRITQLALLGLSALAWYSFQTVLKTQGLLETIETFTKRQLIPGTTISTAGLVYTGVEPIDRILHLLNGFFWPVLHDNDYIRGTRSKMFIGQFMTGWTIVMLESERPGNTGRFVSNIVLWGILTQVFGYAFAMPTWMALTLGASWISNPKPSHVVPHSQVGRAIPWSILLGFLIPGALAYLPAPGLVTYQQKLQAMALWQVFPIWTGIAQFVIKRLFSDYAVEATSSRAWGWKLGKALKTPYIFVLVVAGLIRMGSIARIIYDIQYSALNNAPTWEIFRILLFPKLLDPTVKHESIAAGSAAFLEWDETIGQAALVLYAAAQCFQAWKPRTGSDWLFLLLGLPATWLLFGSSGVAVALLATRDDFVLRQGVKPKKLTR